MLKVEGKDGYTNFFKIKSVWWRSQGEAYLTEFYKKKERINLILKAEISAPNLTKLLALKLISVLSNNKVH